MTQILYFQGTIEKNIVCKHLKYSIIIFKFCIFLMELHAYVENFKLQFSCDNHMCYEISHAHVTKMVCLYACLH